MLKNNFSGVEPTPEQPTIAIWLSIMDIIRRNQQPYILNYPIPPNITMSDHGEMIRKRLTKKNPLCTLNNVIWKRANIFKPPTQAELNNGTVWEANLMDPLTTLLPQFDVGMTINGNVNKMLKL